MRKRVGNIEIARPHYAEWVTVTMHYNESTAASFDLRSLDDVLDLEYAIRRVREEMEADRASLRR